METKSTLDQYQHHFQKDQEAATEALQLFPDGINSDSRYTEPYPVYIERAQGAKKWGLDGQEFIDYWAGHGALLFGHNPPELVKAVTEQIQIGVHFGACHLKEIKWGQLVQQLIPSAERIRFTNSGTEANQLAVQLAQSYTGKKKLLLFEGHYHGWLYPVYPTNQIADDSSRIICPPNCLETVEQHLRTDSDIAAIILEPTGPCSGVVPINQVFLSKLREMANSYGVVLIFDEVITGFRVSAGGAQAHYNIIPDITTLGKILTGGLPGGAITGKKEILDLLSHHINGQPNNNKIAHYGTFSGNALSAATGIVTLETIIAQPPYEYINQLATVLRTQLNELFTSNKLKWVVYGEFSCIKFLIDYDMPYCPATSFDAYQVPYKTLLARGNSSIKNMLRKKLLLQGVDISFSSVISTAHTMEDITTTVIAFEKAIHEMKKEGSI